MDSRHRSKEGMDRVGDMDSTEGIGNEQDIGGNI